MMIIVNTVLYGQNYKDSMSLIMKNIESSTSKAGDEKDESMMENTELLRNGLKDLLGLIEYSEQYVNKAIVTFL